MSGTQQRSPASGRIDTWTSGDGAPAVPRDSERADLVEVLDDAAPDGCIVVRVTLEATGGDAATAMKEQLLDSDPVLGTSIGRSVGPAAPDTFALVVAPGYDLAAVGRTIADVDGVADVSAAAFRAGDNGDKPLAGTGGADEFTGVSQDAIDEAFTELRESTAVQTYEDILAELSNEDLGDEDAVDLGPLLDDTGDDVPDASRQTGDPVESAAGSSGVAPSNGHDTGDAAANGHGPGETTPSVHGAGDRADDRDRADSRAPEVGWEAVVDRLEELSERVEAMELRLSAIERRMARNDGGTAHAGAGTATNGSLPTTDGGRSRGAPGLDGELGERLADIETSLAEVERWQRRLKTALLADPP